MFPTHFKFILEGSRSIYSTGQPKVTPKEKNMIIFIPSFSRIIKSPRYYLFGLGVAFLLVAIAYSIMFSIDFPLLQPTPAICSVFGGMMNQRVCTETDCQRSQLFSVKNYRMPTTAHFTPPFLSVNTRSTSETCQTGVSMCYEPGWKVNSNISPMSHVSSHMVTTDFTQANLLTQLITNQTDDTFFNCFVRDGSIEWYHSDFPLLLPQTDLIIICVFYPLAILCMGSSLVWLTVKCVLEKKKKQKAPERQRLVINNGVRTVGV